MVLSRILGTDMSLLFFLRFLLNKGGGEKAAGLFNKLSIVNCSFLGFNRHIISTLQVIKVCDYLFLSSLRLRFIIAGCRSTPMISIGGELNDFNE